MFIIVYDINGVYYAQVDGYEGYDEPLKVYATREEAEQELLDDTFRGHLGMVVELS